MKARSHSHERNDAAMRSLGLLMIALCMNLSAGAAEKTLELVDLSRTLDESLLEIREAKIERIESDGKGGLSVRYDASDAWPGVRFNAPQGAWRLEAFQYLTLELRNPSDEIVTVGLRVDDAETRKTNTGHLQRQIALRPGGSGALNVYLSAKAPAEKKPEFFGMRGTPFAPGYGAGGGGDSAGIDTQAVVSINVFAPKPATPGQFEILAIRAEGLSVESRKDDFYPFIDEYGQYAHKEWPRHIRSEDDFAAAIREEEADLAQNPAPASRNAYGGWDDGPKLEATGFFRPAKHEGRWWLVDPDGKLFFSHGLDCVNPAEPTPIEERASWFCLLPDRAGIFGAFYGTGRAQRFYFAGRNVETYDFGSANLMRKYGSSWQETHADLAHRRLASWGFNTIGNWSDEGIYLLQRTPYVVAIHAPSPVIQSDTGHWKTFPDVFDPGFEAAHRQRMEAERGKSAGDPWCIGYFVGNELPWQPRKSFSPT